MKNDDEFYVNDHHPASNPLQSRYFSRHNKFSTDRSFAEESFQNNRNVLDSSTSQKMRNTSQYYLPENETPFGRNLNANQIENSRPNCDQDVNVSEDIYEDCDFRQPHPPQEKSKNATSPSKWVQYGLGILANIIAITGIAFVVVLHLQGSSNDKRLTVMSELLEQVNINLHRGFIELDDGWIAPFNGFKYKYIATYQNWSESRTHCQDMGGDLAVFGVQDWNTRRIIQNHFVFNNVTWIGLSVESFKWKWTQGKNNSEATNETIFWGPNVKLNKNFAERCAWINSDLYTDIASCQLMAQALCEKAFH